MQTFKFFSHHPLCVYDCVCVCVCVFTCISIWAQSLRAQSGDDFAGMRAALHGHISVMCEMVRKVKAGN